MKHNRTVRDMDLLIKSNHAPEWTPTRSVFKETRDAESVREFLRVIGTILVVALGFVALVALKFVLPE